MQIRLAAVADNLLTGRQDAKFIFGVSLPIFFLIRFELQQPSGRNKEQTITIRS